MTEKERSDLTLEVDRLMNTFLEQADILGKRILIAPLAREDFRWLIHNPSKNLIGITGICPGAAAGTPEKFCCIIVNSYRAMHYQDEGFQLEDILSAPDAIQVIPAKDILSKIL